MDKIKKAWGDHYPAVEGKLDRDGWYDGSNDSPQKIFDGLKVDTAIYQQRPISLRDNFIESVEEVIDTPHKVKPKK